MKKNLLVVMTVAMATFMSLTSCDRDHWDDGWRREVYVYDDGGIGGGGSSGTDQTITYYLDGMWRGNTYWYNTWQGHNYTISEIEFLPTSYHASTGTGYWVDYYDNYVGNYYIFNNITWKVQNGIIYVHFVQENSDVQIYDYTISEKYFDGYLNSGGQDVEFQLDYITAPYYGSWDKYVVTVYDTTSSKAGYSSSKGSMDSTEDEYSKVIWNRSLHK